MTLLEKAEELTVVTESMLREKRMRRNVYIYIYFFFTLHVYHKRLMGHIPIVKLGSVLILLRALKRVFSQPSEWNTGRNARAAQSCIVKMIQQA